MNGIWILIGTVVFIAFIVLLYIALAGWRNARATKGKMVAEIWEPSGFPVRHLVDIEDKIGKTVIVDNLTYALPKEPALGERDKMQHYYPSRRYVLWPQGGILPFGKVTLRIESWEKDNPEPIRPFYGSVDEDGKFSDSQLTVTAAEWSASKREQTAVDIGFDIQESEARQKVFEKALMNIPNKGVMYIGIGICAILGLVGVIYALKNSGVLSAIAPYFGIAP